jgi:hypothetical protein
MLVEQFHDPTQVLFIDPVENETVRCIDALLVAFGFDL